MQNQTGLSNSAFKMPQVPQPQRAQSESLLFNDILEEINTTIRNQLSEFLQVQPYRVFNLELTNFFKRINRLKQEGQQNGTNISRLANSSQMVLTNSSRPSSSFNFRAPSSTMSMISCKRNNTIRQPENNFQPIPLNPFKPPVHIGVQSNELVLPRVNQSSCASQSSSNMCTTIVEVSHGNNNNTETNDNHEHFNPPGPVFNCPTDPINAYSDMTIVVENNSVSASHKNENINDGGSGSIDSLLEAVGFKINVGLPDCNKTTKSNDNESNGDHIEKYLSKWSIDLKIIKVNKSGILLTGTLLEADRSTVVEKHHKAGLVICRKGNDLLKTNNGIYRLVGKIIRGSPDELYQECLSKDGFPMRWRTILNKYSHDDKSTKKPLLNFSLESPAAPIVSMKPIKNSVNLDISMTRGGKVYSHTLMPHKKRKVPENEVSEKTNYATMNEKLPLLASTPKRPKRQPLMHETPTQILKKKFHQNLHHKTNSRTQKKIDDSINVTKKRQSSTKKQAGKLLKQISPVKMPQSMSSASSSKNSTKSSVLQQSSLKLSINSTKSSIKQTPLSEKNVKVKKMVNPVKAKSTKTIKIVKPNISIHDFKKRFDNSTILKNQVVKKKKMKCPSSPVADIFGEVDFDSFENSNNINIMLSPGKLSVISGSDKSRCETPPLFGHQWSSTTKSLVLSEPPTPLGKLVEAKALKRIHPPKITLDEELKNVKKMNKPLDFKTASKKINKLLQFEGDDNEY